MAIPLFGDDGVSVKDCTNAIHANRRLGNCIGRGRKILDRLEKLAQVRQVNRQGADRHNPGQDVLPYLDDRRPLQPAWIPVLVVRQRRCRPAPSGPGV